MAGLTLADVRAAIGAQLAANIEGQTNVDVDNEGKPAPVLRLSLAPGDAIDYWQTFGSSGLAAVRFHLTIDPAGADQSATQRLDRYLSVGTGNGWSVVDALMSDKTLGGVADTMQVEMFDNDPLQVTATLLVTVHIRKQGANV